MPMRIIRCVLIVAVCCGACLQDLRADDDVKPGEKKPRPSSAANREILADVVEALHDVPLEGTAVDFALGGLDLPRGGHLQGIQMRADPSNRRNLALLSHDSATVGYLLVAEFPADFSGQGRVIHLHEFPSDGQSPPLRHAGGCQLAGDVLAVGLEDNQRKTRSEVQFWDLSDLAKPMQLTHLTIRRRGEPEDKTSGAVGLVEREKDYLVAVANWDSRAIDFYTSNGKPPLDVECRFELRTRWEAGAADKADWKPDRLFGKYQAVNLLADTSGQTFLVGFATTPLGQDVVDLFAVDLEQPPDNVLRKLARKTMKLAAGNHFRYAGGLWIDQGRVTILSSGRNLGRQTRLNVAR